VFHINQKTYESGREPGRKSNIPAFAYSKQMNGNQSKLQDAVAHIG
jgi:hypothetical protein